ncbi:hypothetical protein [Spiroplasma tabanidicola]|uniref:Uncharacterized protein n=1 Tax=Spiroplasma tabanidicola TaxID=324079 RepID=A0A6I6CBI4_9MOLU|nr:hypothetical protein [Spiroplasma tabanidicola]QGS52325.1 hypothetical protein STABA_v1c09720 [Spiroplasma tabanidicola]
MKINKNFEFSLKLMVLIGLVSFLIFDFIRILISPKPSLDGIPVLERFSHYYAFFTTQSNYLVVIYLFYSLFTQYSYNKKPPFGIELGVTVYITLTMVVFWAGIVTQHTHTGNVAKVRASDWFTTCILHLFVPFIMITNFILSSGDTYYSPRVHARFSLYGITIYPVLYSFYAVIRGEFRWETYGPEFFSKAYICENGVWKVNPKGPWSTDLIAFADKVNPYNSEMWYPYWFMNLHNGQLKTTDIVTGQERIWQSYDKSESMILGQVVMGYLFIISLVVFFQYLYLFINNVKYYRWHDIDGNLISKAEHDYWLRFRKFKRQEARSERKLIRLEMKKEYKDWLKSLKNLSTKEKLIKLIEFRNNRTLKNGLKKADIKKLNLEKKQHKIALKQILNEAKTKDRAIIKQNLRDAAWYAKLVKKGIATRRIE